MSQYRQTGLFVQCDLYCTRILDALTGFYEETFNSALFSSNSFLASVHTLAECLSFSCINVGSKSAENASDASLGNKVGR